MDILVNKKFFSKKGKTIEIRVEYRNNMFTTRIVVDALILSENMTSAIILDSSDYINPHIEDIEKINEVNGLMIDLCKKITSSFNEK